MSKSKKKQELEIFDQASMATHLRVTSEEPGSKWDGTVFVTLQKNECGCPGRGLTMGVRDARKLAKFILKHTKDRK